MIALTLMVIGLNLVASFNNVARIRTSSSSGLKMAGGRSPSEKGLSKRGMFLELKKKLKTAAELPGFFQVGEGEPVSTLVFDLYS